jgi:hypothetical protein
MNPFDSFGCYAILLCQFMASLHKQPGKPNWFCAFTDQTGKRHFKSTGTADKKEAWKISNGWVKAAELATQKNLTVDRARKLIESTVGDVMETTRQGLPNETLKKFFLKAAELAGQGSLDKERLQRLIGGTVAEVATLAGESMPSATIRDWCKRWLEYKALEAAPRTHERYETSVNRFVEFLGTRADKDLTTLRVDDIIRFRDSVAKRLSVTSTNMDLKVMRACLYSAVKQDLLDKNVATKVATLKQRGESKRRAFTLEAVRKILEQGNQAGGEWRGLVLTAVYTGQRLGDIASLTWTQLDLVKDAMSRRSS